MIPNFFKDFEHVSLEMMPKSLQDNFLELNPSNEKLLNMFEKDSQRMKNFKNWDEDILKSIQAKTLLINGAQDIVLNEHILEMNQLIPNSEVLILPATHGAYLMPDFDGKINHKLIDCTTEKILSFLEN